MKSPNIQTAAEGKVNWVDLFKKTTEVVSSTLDLSALEREILEFLKKLLDAEAASLLLRDDETGELVFSIALGEAGSAVEMIRLPPGEGIAGWVAENNSSLCVEDARRDSRFCRDVDDDTAFVTRSVLAVPLRAAGRVIGVLEVINRIGGGGFPPEHLSILEALSGLIAVAVDHARRIAEVNEYSRELEHRVEMRTNALRWAQTKLLHAQKMAGLGSLAAGVAHEVNNPLSFVVSNMDQFGAYALSLTRLVRDAENIIAKAPGDDADAWAARFKEDDAAFVCSDVEGLVNDCKEGLKRIATIVSRLKEFSGVDRKCLKKVNLIECVNEVVKRLKIPDFIQLALIDEGVSPIWAEGERLSQAFMNCINNSLAAVESTKKPRIEILLKNEDKNGRVGVLISIKDNGCGLSGEAFERAFEPFFTTKDIGKGAGLGLSETYAIVADHDGEARICPAGEVPARGTKVELWFPVNRDNQK